MHTWALSGTYLKDEWVHWVLLHHGCTCKTVLTDEEVKKRSPRNQLGGLNLSHRREWGSARLNFLWPLPHWHTDSLNNMQTSECVFPFAWDPEELDSWFQANQRKRNQQQHAEALVCARNQCCRAARFKNSWHVCHTVGEVCEFTRGEL